MEQDQSNEQQHLRTYYKNLEDQASDVILKIKHLIDVMPKNGLAVKWYPSGIFLDILRRVTGSLTGKSSIAGNHYVKIETSHQTMFHLVMNNSPVHKQFERKQSSTGGHSSIEVVDLGDFRIVEVIDGLTGAEADFSLYRTKDDFNF